MDKPNYVTDRLIEFYKQSQKYPPKFNFGDVVIFERNGEKRLGFVEDTHFKQRWKYNIICEYCQLLDKFTALESELSFADPSVVEKLKGETND
jgi:hypothetical protein